MAGEIEATFFSVTAADLLGKYVGEPEQKIQSLFKAARIRSPSIIFIDEIDSLTKARTQGDSASARGVLAEIFVGMDGFVPNDKVFVLAATNTPDYIDPALICRFHKLFYVPTPTFKARQEMFSRRFATMDFSDEELMTIAKRTNG